MKARSCIVAAAVLSAGVLQAATWNDMTPWNNAAETAFWNTKGHPYVENVPSAAFPVTGTLAGGGAKVEAGAVASFDGRPSFEDSSPFVRILEAIGLMLFLR